MMAYRMGSLHPRRPQRRNAQTLEDWGVNSDLGFRLLTTYRVFPARWLRLLSRFALASLGLSASASFLHAQAKPTASRVGDLQVGATFNVRSPDYGGNTLRGVGAYAPFESSAVPEISPW
jgi:hypothetical protein